MNYRKQNIIICSKAVKYHKAGKNQSITYVSNAKSGPCGAAFVSVIFYLLGVISLMSFTTP